MSTRPCEHGICGAVSYDANSIIVRFGQAAETKQRFGQCSSYSSTGRGAEVSGESRAGM